MGDYLMDCYGGSKPSWVTPIVAVSAMYPLFSATPKSYELKFIYSLGMHATSNPQLITFLSSEDL
jgi:hypothetical protein